MKKIIAVLSAAIILSVTAFAGLTMAEEDVTGAWNLQSIKQGDAEMNASILSMLGIKGILTINEDGTITMEMGESFQEGTWSADGTIVFDEEIHFRVEDGNLIVESPDETLLFSREEVGGSQLAPAVTNPELSDFEGTWTATTFSAMGISIPVEATGVQIILTLADGKAAVSETVQDLENEGEIIDSMEAEFDTELQEDGTLYVDFAGQNILEKLQIEAEGIHLTLHEDGRISGTIPEIEKTMTVTTEGEDAADETEADSSGDSAGSDGGSSGGESADPSMYLILEKAE